MKSLLFLLLLALVGCGSQGDALSDTRFPWGGSPPAVSAGFVAAPSGRLELLLQTSRFGPDSKFRITGFDPTGQVVFGPSEVEPSGKLEISAPVTMTSVEVLLVTDRQIVGGLSIPAFVVANTLTSLSLPEFVTLQRDLSMGDSDFDISPPGPSQRAVFSTASRRFFAVGPFDTLLDFEETRPGSVGLERFTPGVYAVAVEGRYFLDFTLTGENVNLVLRVEDARGRSMAQAFFGAQGRFSTSMQQIVDLRRGNTVRLFVQASPSGGFVDSGVFSALQIGAPSSPPPPP